MASKKPIGSPEYERALSVYGNTIAAAVFATGLALYLSPILALVVAPLCAKIAFDVGMDVVRITTQEAARSAAQEMTMHRTNPAQPPVPRQGPVVGHDAPDRPTSRTSGPAITNG